MEQFLETFTKTTIEKKILGLVGVVGAIIFLDYFLFMSGQWEKQQELASQVETLQLQLLDKQQKAKDLTGFRREVERLKQRLREAEEKLPKNADLDKLIKDISYEAQQSGLMVSVIEPKDEQYQGTFAANPMAMGVEGTYHEIAVFLDRLAKLPRIVNVTDITLTDPRERNKKIVLRGQYSATAYRFLEKGQTGKKRRGR